jgi:hypothetical protein
MKTTCRGWSSDGFSVEHRNVDVHVCGVCTCSWHKQCVADKRCRELFANGGSWGEERTLERLMRAKGRKMPRSWKDGYSWKKRRLATYDAKQKAQEEFEKLYFKKCRPVRVTVETI